MNALEHSGDAAAAQYAMLLVMRCRLAVKGGKCTLARCKLHEWRTTAPSLTGPGINPADDSTSRRWPARGARLPACAKCLTSLMSAANMRIDAGHMAAAARRDVLACFGDPVVDIVVRCSQAFLQSVSAEEGGSQLVSPADMAQLRSDALKHTDTQEPEVRCDFCPLCLETFAGYMPRMPHRYCSTVSHDPIAISAFTFPTERIADGIGVVAGE